MSRLNTTWPWLVAGLAFAAYPALRPYTDETTLTGLAAMASGRWLAAHLLGMLGFALLPVALATLRTADPSSRAARAAVPLAYLGAALLLPYYGGEAFGLHAIGAHAVHTGDLSMVGVVDAFRYGALAITSFGLGLLAVAASGVLAVVAVWRHGALLRAGMTAVGLALALYLPQFFAPAGVRVGHGLLLALGCWTVAAATARVPAAGRYLSTLPGSVVASAATNAS